MSTTQNKVRQTQRMEIVKSKRCWMDAVLFDWTNWLSIWWGFTAKDNSSEGKVCSAKSPTPENPHPLLKTLQQNRTTQSSLHRWNNGSLVWHHVSEITDDIREQSEIWALFDVETWTDKHKGRPSPISSVFAVCNLCTMWQGVGLLTSVFEEN